MSLVLLVRGRQEKLTDYVKERMSNAASKTSSPWWQSPNTKAVPSIEFSSAKESVEREKVEDTMLDQFQTKTEGSEEERDASPSTTKARSDLVHIFEVQQLLSIAADMGGGTLVKEIKI